MTENMFGSRVLSMRVFWKSLKPWIKKVIFWAGFVIGISEWAALIAGVFPLIVLIFLGNGTSALIAQILVVVAVLVVLLGVVIFSIWLLKLFVFGVSYLLLSEKNSSWGEMIFDEGEADEKMS